MPTRDPSSNTAQPSTSEQQASLLQTLESALEHHNAGELPEARSLYQRVLQLDPNQPAALHLLGVLAHQLGDHTVAENLITKAIALQPGYAEAHCNLGNTIGDLGRLDEAVACYRKAIAIQPDFAEAHGNLGSSDGARRRSLIAIQQSASIPVWPMPIAIGVTP
jgi:Flp pilus assembly protein TadD